MKKIRKEKKMEITIARALLFFACILFSLVPTE